MADAPPAPPPRRRPEPEHDRGPYGLSVLFLATATALFAREAWSPSLPEGLLVEVTGDVAAPGLYVVDPPTLAAAVEAAGAVADDVPETTLVSGDRVAVDVDGAHVVRASQPLLAALPIDVGLDGADALAAVPGLGPRLADAIVADREARGPFRERRDLARVEGLGPQRLERVERYLTVGDVPPAPPVDLNDADADTLATLSGIGPALAARIVAERARARFTAVDDLDRVAGIGPATIARLRGAVVVGR